MRKLALVMLLALTGCSEVSPATCSIRRRCVDGECLPSPLTGHTYCAFFDRSCPSGLRWDRDTPDGLGDQCYVRPSDGGTD